MVGGYAMIDCTGLDLTGESQNIPAIYQQLTEQNAKKNKPVLLYNVENDGDVLTPTWARLSVGLGGTRDLTIDGYIISVEADGDITVTESGGGSVDPSDVYTIVDVNGLPLDESINEGTDGWYTTLAALDSDKPIFFTNFYFAGFAQTGHVSVFLRKITNKVIVYAPTGNLVVNNDNTTEFTAYF